MRRALWITLAMLLIIASVVALAILLRAFGEVGRLQ